MKLLLDTHVLLWVLGDPGMLAEPVADAIRDQVNEVSVSAASIWEIAIKASAGKLELPGPAADWLPLALDRTGIVPLDIQAAHALAAGALPSHHRDPFDRMLVAQARLEGMTLVSRDRRLAEYGIDLLLA